MPEKTTLHFGGHEVPCRVTMGAMLRYKRLTGEDVASLTDGDIENLLTWIYCCVQSACKADGMDFNFTLEEFCDRLTPDDMEQWNRIQAEMNAKKNGQ